MAATLAAQRGIPFFVREQAAGRWSFTTHSSLVGARVLIVGAGDIGRTIGRMLAGFDVELTYVARTARDGVRADGGPAAAPAGRRRRHPHRPGHPGDHRHGRRRLPRRDARRRAAGQRRPRGRIVDTDALLAELTAGRLRAALDVTDPEPLPAGHPLWSAPGVLLTPHVGGEVPQTEARATATAVDQIARVLAGEPLANVVDRY